MLGGAEDRGVRIPCRVKSKTENWHLLLPWLAFIIKDIEQGLLIHVSVSWTLLGGVSYFICGMVLLCAGTLNPAWVWDQLQQI